MEGLRDRGGRGKKGQMKEGKEGGCCLRLLVEGALAVQQYVYTLCPFAEIILVSAFSRPNPLVYCSYNLMQKVEEHRQRKLLPLWAASVPAFLTVFLFTFVVLFNPATI